MSKSRREKCFPGITPSVILGDISVACCHMKSEPSFWRCSVGVHAGERGAELLHRWWRLSHLNKLANEKVGGWLAFVRPPSDRFWTECGDDRINGGHGLVFAAHHQHTVIAYRTLSVAIVILLAFFTEIRIPLRNN